MEDGHRDDDLRRSLVAAAANAVLVVDAAGTITLANAEAERLLRYAPGTLEGRSIDILECTHIHAAGAPAASENVPDPLSLMASGGKPTVRCFDGAVVAVRVSTRHLTVADGPLAIVTLDALADRRATPSSDATAEPRVTSGQVGRWRLDVATRTLTASPETHDIIGIPPGEPIALERFIAAFAVGDRPLVVALFDRALAGGQAIAQEAKLERAGCAVAVVFGISPERDATGAIFALLGFVVDITQSRSAATRERQRLNEFVSRSNPANRIGIWELDLTTHRSTWDRNMYALYGIEDQTTPPTYELWRSTLHPHDRERAINEVKSDMADGTPSDSEFRIVLPNGDIRNVRSLATTVFDENGIPTRIVGTDWDVTEIRSLGEALREEKDALISSEARYRALTEAMPQMVWVIDGAGQCEYVNWRWLAYTGRTLESSRTQGNCGVIDPVDAARIEANCAALPEREFECEARVRRNDAAYRWHLVRGVPFHDASGARGKWMITATDIEERKASERILAETIAELEHRAHHDPMTNLPNRMLLTDRLTQAIQQAQRAGDHVAVLYLDLDRFKAINDSLGHAAGDCVLLETGTRIVGTLRDGDTASRVGGDEFIVVCTTDGDETALARLAARLLAAVTGPIDFRGERVIVEASIGISVFPADGSDAGTLIRKADAAMYTAKQHGRNNFRRYSGEDEKIVAAAAFEAELRHAIGAGELVVYYQPIMNLSLGRPTAAEALVRWQHPQRGLLAPSEFIPFAEERGLVAQIGDVVLQAACAMLERLRRAGHQDVSIAVNVSAHQFGKSGFVESIVEALRFHTTDPHQLTIEITESTVMGNGRATLATLRRLRATGVNLSLDDFGTGYSSLAYIKRFPITTLKIDRSFVNDIAYDATDQAIAKTIITLAHSLGMSVIAEGVETLEQLTKLHAFGVDSIQGYYLSRPVAGDDFMNFLAAFGDCRLTA